MWGSCICILKEGLFFFFCISLEKAELFMITYIYLKKNQTSVGSSVPPSLFSLFLEFRWHFCYKTVSLNKREEYSGY